ncbi:MAG: hypothetical protein AB7T63_14685 [Planctomycetota bacterium]
MSRLRIAFALLVLAGLGAPPSARADEAPPASSPAAAPTVPASFPAARLAWLPVSPLHRAVLVEEHPRLAGRLGALARRGEALERQLADAKLAASARAGVEAQRDKTDAEARELLAEVLATGIVEAVTPELLHAVAEAPPGPHAPFRHAMALGARVLELDPAVRQRIETARTRIEGALLTIEAQRDVLPEAWREVSLGAEDERLRKELATRTGQALDRQVRTLERRWWGFLDYVLDRPQRAAWFRALPPDWLQKVDPAQQLYDLPEITPSQAAQIASRLTEYEAEASPDQAAVRRLRSEIEAAPDEEARKALRREMADAQKRLGEVGVALAKGLKGLLTPEQLEAYEAVPPRLSANDRRQSPERVLERVAFTSEQRAKLADMRKELAGTVRAMQTRAAELNREKAAYGPDAPQQMMMMAELAEIRGDGARLGRRALGTVFLHVLTDQQLLAWLLDPR